VLVPVIPMQSVQEHSQPSLISIEDVKVKYKARLSGEGVKSGSPTSHAKLSRLPLLSHQSRYCKYIVVVHHQLTPMSTIFHDSSPAPPGSRVSTCSKVGKDDRAMVST